MNHVPSEINPSLLVSSDTPESIVVETEEGMSKPLSKEQIQLPPTYLETLFEHNSIATAFINAESRIFKVNKAMCRLFGYTQKEFIGLTVGDITYHEDQNIRLAKSYYLNKAPISQFSLEKRYVRKNGEVFWGKLTITAYRDEQGVFQYAIPAIQDISQQKNADNALKASEQRFRSVFYGNVLAMGIGNKTTPLSEVNEAMSSLFGYTKEEFKQLKVADITYPPDREIGRAEYQQLIKREITTFTVEKRYLKKNGQLFIGKLSMSGVYDDDGSFLYSVPTIEDITDKRKSMLELMKTRVALAQKVEELATQNKVLQKYIDSNLELERFAYVASHDLKEPLRNIISFSQLLSSRYVSKLDQDAQDYIQFIINGTENMALLVEDLLTYSRVSAKLDDHFEQLSMNEIIHFLENSLKQQIEEHQINIQYNNLPPSILAIKTKIQQVFLNLLSNAIKFRQTEVPAQISICVEELSTHWQFAIQDNGIGIEQAYQEQIFLLFKKLHNKTLYAGSGLGLAICRKIVEQHEGKIWVESEYGKGATFYFTIRK